MTLFQAEPSPGLPRLPANGWYELILGDIEVCRVPGDHYSMLISPQVSVLAERLAAVSRYPRCAAAISRVEPLSRGVSGYAASFAALRRV